MQSQKRIKRGWLVVILAPADISSAGAIYITHNDYKSQHFFIKNFTFFKIIKKPTLIYKRLFVIIFNRDKGRYNMDLINVKGLGKKTIEYLNNVNIKTIEDLVRYYPYKFNYLVRKDINNPSNHDSMIIDGMVISNPIVNFFKGKMNRLSFRINIGTKEIKVVIFNRAFLKNNIKITNYVTIIGKYNPLTETITASNILLSKLPDYPVIEPIYHLTKKITNKQINSYILSALDTYNVSNNIPDILKDKYNLIDEDSAINIIHNPKDEKSLKTALKTLKYEELFTYMKKVKELKDKNEVHDNKYIKNIDREKVNEFIKQLPFELTIDQDKVLKEMLNDLESDIRMNRLLQGDVGSGKTIIAFLLSYALYTTNYQTAFMAPTEILAIQHYENAIKLFKDTNLKVELLTGKMTLKEKKEVYKKIENNEVNLLIGTHALISDNVLFNNLGLVITDEQHRFGVNQRDSLKNKSDNVDVLMMSATPIPRTYALTIYGDTDVSSIKTMPKGRIPVITKLKKTNELKDVLENIYSALKNNNQAYVIAPMIEESEDTDYTNVYDLKHKFELAFKNYKVEIMHGKMTKEEKDKVMQDYLDNKIHILISTTVIEVGVDIPNATVIVIFDADRFGLSQLHQLRGRVGRNSLQSYCFLISDKDKERLNIMEEENDGYKISEADFKLRGQGDLFGNRQSGELIFKLSDIRKDYDLLVKVRDDVNELYK